MKCGDLTEDLLLDYADWRLSPAEREPIARHLDSCIPCQDRRDEVELMAGAIKGAAEAPPAALLEGLQPSLPGVPVQEAPASFRHWVYAFAGASAALVLGCLAYFALPISNPAPAARTPRPSPVIRVAPPVEAPPPSAPFFPPAVPAPAPAPLRPADPAPLLGDVNGDGRVDIADARRLQQMIISGDVAASNADLNRDGVVDIADVRAIVRIEVSGR